MKYRLGFEFSALRLKRPRDPDRAAFWQRNVQIVLVATNVAVSTLIALKTFGLI